MQTPTLPAVQARTRRRTGSRGAALVLAVVTSLVSGLLLASPAGASVSTLYERVDTARTEAGLAPVVRSAQVAAVAQAWAEEIARSGTLKHNPSFASQIPTGWSRAGENVGYVYGGSSPDARLHQLWMDSAGHRANILGSYNTIGIGRAVDSQGRVWGVQVFASYAVVPSPMGLFTDVHPGEPYYSSIEWLKARGITGGYPDGSFGREDPVTRGQMAAFLYRAAGSPAFRPPSRATFSDVPAGSSFHLQIEWLVAEGIAARADRYDPRGTVTRGQMAAFIARATGPSVLSAPARATFHDVPVGAMFYPSVEWMVDEGVAASTSSRYHPESRVTREQMAAFLHRAYT